MEGRSRVTLPPMIEISFGRVRCPTAADFKAKALYIWHLASGSCYLIFGFVFNVFCLSYRVTASHTIYTSAVFSLWKHTSMSCVCSTSSILCLVFGQTFTRWIYVTCMPLLSPLAMAAWSTGKSRQTMADLGCPWMPWVFGYRDPIANPATMRRQDMCCLHAPDILLLEKSLRWQDHHKIHIEYRSIKSHKPSQFLGSWNFFFAWTDIQNLGSSSVLPRYDFFCCPQGASRTVMEDRRRAIGGISWICGSSVATEI